MQFQRRFGRHRDLMTRLLKAEIHEAGDPTTKFGADTIAVLGQRVICRCSMQYHALLNPDLVFYGTWLCPEMITIYEGPKLKT